MGKRTHYLILALLSFLSFIIAILILVSYASNTTQEFERGLCVDGDGDINLEGFMCDKKINLILGYDTNSNEGQIISTLSLLWGVLLFLLSFIFAVLATINPE